MVIKTKPSLTLSSAAKLLLTSNNWSPSNLALVVADDKHEISAWIDLRDWMITIQVDPSVAKKSPQQDLENLIYSCIEHEIGHWKYCPFDGEMSERIIAAASKGLQRAGIVDARRMLAHRAYNLFSDIIVNSVNLAKDITGSTRAGLDVFYNKEGRIAGAFSIAYAAFVRTQTLISHVKLSAVEKYDNNEKCTKSLARQCAVIFDYRHGLTHLLERGSWERQAEEVTLIMAPYLEDLTEEMSAGQNECKGTIGSGSCAVSAGELSAGYEKRANQLVFEVVPPTYTTLRTGIRPLQNIDKINPYGTRLIGKDLVIGQYATELRVRAPLRNNEPAATLLIVDSSATMNWKPADFSGAYDAVIIASYALLSKRSGYAGVLNFSDKTIWSGWHEEWHSLKKILLTYQRSGTALDTGILAQACNEAPSSFHAFLITDGEISRPDSIITTLAPSVAAGSQFTLIQIGSPTALSGIAARIGDVHIVRKSSELNGLLLGRNFRS